VKKVGVNYYICRGRKCGSRSLSPAMPTWKLDMDTLKIFLNQKAIKRKLCFRRPSMIQYFLLDLWCRLISCRFPPAYFLFPTYLHTRVYIYIYICVCVCVIRLLVSMYVLYVCSCLYTCHTSASVYICVIRLLVSIYVLYVCSCLYMCYTFARVYICVIRLLVSQCF
jgi:hypothetical protein